MENDDSVEVASDGPYHVSRSTAAMHTEDFVARFRAEKEEVVEHAQLADTLHMPVDSSVESDLTYEARAGKQIGQQSEFAFAPVGKFRMKTKSWIDATDAPSKVIHGFEN